MSLSSNAAASGPQAPNGADYVFEGAKWGASTAAGTPGGVVTYSFATGNFAGDPFHFDAPLDPAFQSEVRSAFAEWSSLGNITFQEVPDSTASDVRIGWEAIDGPFNTLGETYYTYQDGHLQHTWIGFDDGESYHAGANGETLADGATFLALAEHEIGHAIGLDHYETGPALMNHVLRYGGPQASDIDGVQALYGAAPPAAVAQGGAAAAGHDAALAAAHSATATDPADLLAGLDGVTAEDLAGLVALARSVREHLPSDVPGALDVLRAAEPDFVAAATPILGADRVQHVVDALNGPDAANVVEAALHNPALTQHDWFMS